MNKHWRYFSYVLRHKWFVFVECCKLGVPWRGVAHDLSKFRPSEWIPYARYFYGDYLSKEGVERSFDLAWLHHQKRNKHHWQWWVLPLDDGGQKILPMPDVYCKEMLADWYGAGRALGKPDTVAWYVRNRDKMLLHHETRAWIEQQLGIQEDA